MTLRDYWRLIVQRGWIVVLAALLTAGSAYLWSASQPSEYRATSKLIVTAESLDWGRLQALKQRLSGYGEDIRSEGTAFRVLDKLKLDANPYDLLSRVAVSPDLNTLIIQIDVTDRDPVLAGRIANAFAEDFVAEIEQEQADQLREDRVQVSIIQPAGTGGQIAPRPRINAVAGALLGLLLGGLIVLALEILDDTIKSRDDIERYLGADLILLGQVPPGQVDLAPQAKRNA
jgi:capsular polysaccharide biosynthesis protein